MLECYEAISFVAKLFLVTKRIVEGAKYVEICRFEKEKMFFLLFAKKKM